MYSTEDFVYGRVYNDAVVAMNSIEQSISQYENIGFASQKECYEFMAKHHLDILAYNKMRQSYSHVAHNGRLLNTQGYMTAYSNVLFTPGEEGKKVIIPTGFSYTKTARIVGEATDGLSNPLNHRDYNTPTGYFDESKGTFNCAIPFKVYAKETGADTSHIYTYIEHLAGECAPWLLAWLRAKIVNPTKKTEVVPIFVSAEQGTGKTTFCDVICRGLFGKENVLVTDQFDSTARFNADNADALIVCLEEKEETDKRNPVAALKSRATGSQVRKEQKGVDPYYQQSYTEFVMTTNREVPIKFEGYADQRRFMVMDTDGKFSRKAGNPYADEVFAKLYGVDSQDNKVGVPFVEDTNLIAQFKHELYTNEELANLDLRNFPHTAAYERCRSIPRTTEQTEIESILRAIAPFIKEALLRRSYVKEIKAEDGDTLLLSNVITTPLALAYASIEGVVALCRPLVFYNNQKGEPFNHATVERILLSCKPWLLVEFGLELLPVTAPLANGFPGIQGRHRMAPTARFRLYKETDIPTPPPVPSLKSHYMPPKRVDRTGERLRVNGQWKPDPQGQYETVNEMIPGTITLENKTENVQYMDTFLLEADECSKEVYQIEQEYMKQNPSTKYDAKKLFAARLSIQQAKADKMFNDGVACRVVYSGSKSYHILVRIKDTPTTLDEYKWLHAHLCEHFGDTVIFDVACNTPAHLTRAPITVARTTMYHDKLIMGVQKLIHENWNNVYDYDWRPLYKQWQERPLHPWEQPGHKVVPCRKEYQDAMLALLKGTFFTDSEWDGRRQQCFFPAYRLCRLAGYTHEQLWSPEGVLDGLDRYSKQNEVSYWRTRETSPLIKLIDEEMDNATRG